MTSENIAIASEAGASPTAVDDRFLNELVARAQAEGLQLTGEGGLLQQLTKRLLESALEGEVTEGPRRSLRAADREEASAPADRCR